MNDRIYFDFNASTPVATEVLSGMQPWLMGGFGNASSTHWAGVSARDAIEMARSQVAALLSCDPTAVVFTSGGTESNNQAIKGVFFERLKAISHPHLITTAIEHPSISQPCRFISELGASISFVRVNSTGQVDPDEVQRAVRPETVLISVMHANNEVGTIQPIEALGRIAREREVLFHSDAAQTAGKIPVDVEMLGVDFLSIAGHKLYGPKGVGALYAREGLPFKPFMHGADHEAGRRAGTENVAGIVGLGLACQLASERMPVANASSLRDYFWQRLQETFGEAITLNGHLTERLPNTLNVSFKGHCGADILAALPQLAASTGSACHAGVATISPVLEAMGAQQDVAMGAIRFSLGRTSTAVEVDDVIERLQSDLNGSTPTARLARHREPVNH
ncbi:MAG: cysteine desulfurase family protein [Pirellulales bacterium]